MQLLLRSETRYYPQGSIIADSREDARGLLVITSGQVVVIQMNNFLSSLQILQYSVIFAR
jgi:hypothetical protein